MQKSMIRRMVLAAAFAVAASGCGTIGGGSGIDEIAERLANAIEPRIEKIVDAQIEREERAQGIWGTPDSYFYAERQATESDIRATAEEMVATWSEELRLKLDEMIDAKLKGGKYGLE